MGYRLYSHLASNIFVRRYMDRIKRSRGAQGYEKVVVLYKRRACSDPLGAAPTAPVWRSSGAGAYDPHFGMLEAHGGCQSATHATCPGKKGHSMAHRVILQTAWSILASALHNLGSSGLGREVTRPEKVVVAHNVPRVSASPFLGLAHGSWSVLAL